MRYALIRKLDISNGMGVGVSLFVQGCPLHCDFCFNKETWDFNGGQEWTEDIERKFFEYVNQEYITRVSILGGEPLSKPNIITVRQILSKIPNNKSKWLYTGYQWENFSKEQLRTALLADYIVDGPYMDDQKNMMLKYRGSENQRIIDVGKTLNNSNFVIEVYK